jgi:hypothetical protein
MPLCMANLFSSTDTYMAHMAHMAHMTTTHTGAPLTFPCRAVPSHYCNFHRDCSASPSILSAYDSPKGTLSVDGELYYGSHKRTAWGIKVVEDGRFRGGLAVGRRRVGHSGPSGRMKLLAVHGHPLPYAL